MFGWIPVIFYIFHKTEKRLSWLRAASTYIYSALVKLNLTFWGFHEFLFTCFQCSDEFCLALLSLFWANSWSTKTKKAFFLWRNLSTSFKKQRSLLLSLKINPKSPATNRQSFSCIFLRLMSVLLYLRGDLRWLTFCLF